VTLRTIERLAARLDADALELLRGPRR
jgi:hypothetical protein